MNDCSCLTHQGPHWLHLDYMERARNLTLLERTVEALEADNNVQATFIHQAYTQAELVRLTNKLHHIAACGIKEVEKNETLDEQEKGLYRRIREYQREIQ